MWLFRSGCTWFLGISKFFETLRFHYRIFVYNQAIDINTLEQ
jgi:hypothetical protein